MWRNRQDKTSAESHALRIELAHFRLRYPACFADIEILVPWDEIGGKLEERDLMRARRRIVKLEREDHQGVWFTEDTIAALAANLVENWPESQLRLKWWSTFQNMVSSIPDDSGCYSLLHPKVPSPDIPAAAESSGYLPDRTLNAVFAQGSERPIPAISKEDVHSAFIAASKDEKIMIFHNGRCEMCARALWYFRNRSDAIDLPLDRWTWYLMGEWCDVCKWHAVFDTAFHLQCCLDNLRRYSALCQSNRLSESILHSQSIWKPQVLEYLMGSKAASRFADGSARTQLENIKRKALHRIWERFFGVSDHRLQAFNWLLCYRHGKSYFNFDLCKQPLELFTLLPDSCKGGLNGMLNLRLSGPIGDLEIEGARMGRPWDLVMKFLGIDVFLRSPFADTLRGNCVQRIYHKCLVFPTTSPKKRRRLE